MARSPKAQMLVKDAAWYYEMAGHLDLIIWPNDLPSEKFISGGRCIMLRLPSKKLLASLVRQGKAIPVPSKKRARK